MTRADRLLLLSPQKIFFVGYLEIHQIYFLDSGPPKSTLESASASVLPFLQQQTDRLTDHATPFSVYAASS